MMKIATTKEQSELLLKAGVKPETADMVWWNIRLSGGDIQSQLYPAEYVNKNSNITPAWSMQALLSLMPAAITPKEIGEPYSLRLYKYEIYGPSIEYGVSYYKGYPPFEGDYIGYNTKVKQDDCEDCIDCLVKLLLEVIESGLMPE